MSVERAAIARAFRNLADQIERGDSELVDFHATMMGGHTRETTVTIKALSDVEWWMWRDRVLT